MSRVIILAAGRGERMGAPKLFAKLPDGRTLLDYQLERLQWTHVTLVCRADGIPTGNFDCVINQQPDHGPFSSLQCALRDDDVFVLPIDVPCPPQQVFASVARGIAAIPTYAGRGGHPVFLSAAFAQSLKALPPQSRLDHILKAAPGVERIPVDSEEILSNLNSPSDLARAFPLLRPPST